MDFAIYTQTDETAIEGATITATPWMPSMDHGIAEEPSSQETEAGLYNIQFEFSMSGVWEVQIDIDADLGSEQVVIPIEVQ